jgi:hypothetical protein
VVGLADYEQAKKELFGRGISGVYHRGSEYALVYKSPRGPKQLAGTVASLVAAGSLLALGGLGLRQWYNQSLVGRYDIKDKVAFLEIVNTCRKFDRLRKEAFDTTLSVQKADLEPYQRQIDSFVEKEIRETMSKDPSITKESLVPLLQTVTEPFAKQIVILLSLIELNVPERDVRATFGPRSTFEQVIHSKVWSLDPMALSDYFHVLPARDNGLLSKFVVAVQYAALERTLRRNRDVELTFNKFCSIWQESVSQERKYFEQAFEELRPRLPNNVTCAKGPHTELSQ